MEEFRRLYEKHLLVKIVTVTLVVLLSIVIMLPLIKIAELFGINLRENVGLNFKVTFANVFLFFLFGICSITIIWLAQKHIHKKNLSELGLTRKVWQTAGIGFVVGAIFVSIGYVVLILNAEKVTITNVIPDDVPLFTYLGYYLYFIVGFIFWNSFIEELGTRVYPIQRLKKHINPHIIFTIMGLIFTVGHFFLRDFNLGTFLNLFTFSYMLSLIYHYSSSIWLVVGVHSGVNWVGFSFMGITPNWKLGTLYNTRISGISSWIVDYSNVILQCAFILLIVFLNHKGLFRKLFPQANEMPKTLK